jgi:hypothetical protein
LSTVLVLDSTSLGNGDDQLGQTLIVNFLRAWALRDNDLDTILMYNTGVTLAEDNTGAAGLLKMMSERGTEILLCGTCVDHFGLRGKLATGTISDMRAIVERLASASKLIYV